MMAAQPFQHFGQPLRLDRKHHQVGLRRRLTVFGERLDAVPFLQIGHPRCVNIGGQQVLGLGQPLAQQPGNHRFAHCAAAR